MYQKSLLTKGCCSTTSHRDRWTALTIFQSTTTGSVVLHLLDKCSLNFTLTHHVCSWWE